MPSPNPAMISSAHQSDIVQGMETANILIRDLPLGVKAGLRRMAQANQRSVQEEVRQILGRAVRRSAPPEPAVSTARRIHARFAALGGVDLPATPARASWRPLPVLGASQTAAKPRAKRVRSKE